MIVEMIAPFLLARPVILGLLILVGVGWPALLLWAGLTLALR